MIGKSLGLPARTGVNFDLAEALARTNQERGSKVGGSGGPGASLGPLRECPGALLEAGELPAPLD